MALSMRFAQIPAATKALLANGRSYPVTGATVDVPYADGAAIMSDQATFLMLVGATPDRPANIPGTSNWPPVMMYDTTLAKPIFLIRGSSPASWTDIAGAAV
jgi:hypothetical protein